VKKSVSTRLRSNSGSTVTWGLNKQASHVSQHSIKKDESVFSFADHLTAEDIPIASSPSPFPGRRTFPGAEDAVVTSDDEEAVEVCTE
jgi:hypothetical protein